MPPKRKLPVGNNGNLDISAMFKKQGKLLLSDATSIFGGEGAKYTVLCRPTLIQIFVPKNSASP